MSVPLVEAVVNLPMQTKSCDRLQKLLKTGVKEIAHTVAGCQEAVCVVAN